MRARKGVLWLCASIAGAVCFGFAALLAIGSIASFPAPVAIGPPPPDLPGEKVAIESASGSLLAGWFIVGQPHVGWPVLLMHGVKANRLEMLGRAEAAA